MINLLTMFAISGGAVAPRDLAQWKAAKSGELAQARDLWGIWRFFGLNGARRISGFDSAGLLRLEQPGSIVNGFVRDGRALVIAGVQGATGVRNETLHIRAPAELGLAEGLRYDLIDLRNNRYLRKQPSTLAELRTIQVALNADAPLILLIRPESKGPHLAWYRGADDVAVSPGGGAIECRVKAAAGSPVELYLDPRDHQIGVATPGFERATAGDFVAVAGAVPQDGIVRLTVRPREP